MSEAATRTEHPTAREATSDAPSVRKATLMLRLFGTLKIPLIGYCRPRIVHIDHDTVVMKIPLNRRTRNHHGTMYFGALAIGADTAAGLAAMHTMEEERKANGHKVSFVFKDARGEFLRRPDGDVHFTCTEGAAVRKLVHKAIASGEREEMPVPVTCTVPSVTGDTPVARFTLTISLKRR